MRRGTHRFYTNLIHVLNWITGQKQFLVSFFPFLFVLLFFSWFYVFFFFFFFFSFSSSSTSSFLSFLLLLLLLLFIYIFFLFLFILFSFFLFFVLYFFLHNFFLFPFQYTAERCNLLIGFTTVSNYLGFILSQISLTWFLNKTQKSNEFVNFEKDSYLILAISLWDHPNHADWPPTIYILIITELQVVYILSGQVFIW